MYLRNRGDVVVFLGQNTPSDYILEVFKKTPFDELISVFTSSPHMSEVEDYLKDLELKLNDLSVKIRICGAQISELLEKGITSDRISLFKNVAELRQNLHLSKN